MRYLAEEINCFLFEVDGEKTDREVCRKANISESWLTTVGKVLEPGWIGSSIMQANRAHGFSFLRSDLDDYRFPGDVPDGQLIAPRRRITNIATTNDEA